MTSETEYGAVLVWGYRYGSFFMASRFLTGSVPSGYRKSARIGLFLMGGLMEREAEKSDLSPEYFSVEANFETDNGVIQQIPFGLYEVSTV